MFEIVLEEDYEDNYDYRKVEWENKDRRDKAEFERWANSSNSRSPRLSRRGTSMNSSKSSKTREFKVQRPTLELPKF